jgi:PhnB protein
MATQLNAYLSFRDNAREAMTFYQSVFGGTLDVSTFADYQASEDPSENNKVMHAQLKTDQGLVLMGADTPNRMDLVNGTNMALSLSGDDESELRGYWDKLSDGGQVTMPLTSAEWGDMFGMLVDPYGVSWLVNISGQPQA